MSLSMLSSMIEAMINVSKCNRRSTKHTCVVSRDDFLKYAAYARRGESVVPCKATDTAEASTTDFSDGSEQLAGSTDSSDGETAKIKLISAADLRGGQKLRSERRTPMKPSQGLLLPPGLGVPAGFSQPAYNKLSDAAIQGAPQGQNYSGTRLNSSAALFVPSFGPSVPGPEAGNSQNLRQSIRVLKDALEDWEANNIEDDLPNGNTTSADDEHILALQQVLSKLTPQDAAVVKGLLESKEATQNNTTPFMDASMMQSMQSGPMLQTPAMFDTWADDVVVPARAMQPPGQFYAPPSSGWAFAPGSWGPPLDMQRTFAPYHGGPRPTWQSNGKHQSKPRKVEGADASESLATHLRDLALLPSERVLMVRKINHVVGDTPAVLKAYFEKFGAVERVMMSATRSASKPARVRRATLGFLVMETAEAVQALLAHGEEHIVEGVTILVGTFESHPIDEKHD